MKLNRAATARQGSQSRRRFLAWALGCFLAGVSALGSAWAADPTNAAPQSPRRTLSLAEAKRLAFTRNWDLLAAQSDVDIATAQKLVAREFPNPTLAYSTSKMSVDDHPAGTTMGNDLWSRNYDTIFAVNQLLEIGGKRSSRKASAQAGLEGAKARLEDARRLLDLGVARAYVAAAQADLNVQILRQSAETMRREAQIAETRLKAGDISKADKAQIEIAAARFTLDAQAAEANAAALRIALEILLGEPQPKGDWTASDSLDTLAAGEPPAPLPTVVARPDLLAAEADLRQTEANVRLQKALRVPDPTLLAQYEHEPPDLPNTIGIGVAFPLPLWNRNRGAISAASATRAKAASQVEKLKAQIAAEILSAQIAFRDARRRWESYRQEVQPRSAEVLQAVSFAYQKGGASLVDLLTAQRNDNEVRLATAQSSAEAAAALAALQAALYAPVAPPAPKR